MSSQPLDADVPASSRSLTAAAVIIGAVLGVIQVGAVAGLAVLVGGMYRDMGGAIPPLTATLLELSSFHLLVPLLTVSDLAVFALFYWLARRQPGLLFVPAALYFVSAGLLMLALYAPMHSAIQLVP